MNKTRNLVEMGEFYVSTVLTEAKKNFPPKDTFSIPGKKVTDTVTPKGLKTKAFDGRGPLSNENEKTLVKPIEKKNIKGKESFTGVEKLSETPEKKETQNINTFMNKSIFDRLYEDVMNDNVTSPEDADSHDALALDLPGTDGDSEEVTITLDRELAKKLHDVLMTVLGSEEEAPKTEEGAPEEGEISDEAAEEEDEEETQNEATELKELPSSAGASLQSKNNKVGDTTSKLTDGKIGDGNVDNKVDGSGKVVANKLIGSGIKSDTTAVKGKGNVVTAKTSKVGSYLAGLK